MNTVYTGKRVRLRPYESADEFTTLLYELDLQEHSHWAPEWWPAAEIKPLFEKHGMLDEGLHFSFFAIERVDTGELIGFEVVQLPKSGWITVEIGTVILQRHWHQGFGREAKELAMCFLFENFPLETVSASTLSLHSRAVAGLEAVGMRLQGELRGRHYSNHAYDSLVEYAITRQEWEQLPVRRSVVRGVRTASTETGSKDQADPAKPERGFAIGEHVILRPVIESDLPALVKLLAENPLEEEPTPWTLQRLKKKFEDKDEPGLWGRESRYFAVVRLSGGLVGFLKENSDNNRRMYWNVIHIAEALEDRDAIGLDALRAYLGYKLKWHDPLRISFDCLECETAKASWFEQAGFACEIRFERRMFHLGRPVAHCLYTWLSEALVNAPADPHRVAGEE